MGTIEFKLCTVRKKQFVRGRLEQPRQDKNLLYRQEEPNEPTKEGPFSSILHESRIASVSEVSRDHPSLVSLVEDMRNEH